MSEKQKRGGGRRALWIVGGLTLFMAVAIATQKPVENPEKVNDGAKNLAAVSLIRLAGYRCDDLTTLRPALIGSGQVVRCNEGRYTYDLKDVGGRWTVTPD